MRLALLPYKEKSAGAKMVAGAIGLDMVQRNQSWSPQQATVILNWGRGDHPTWFGKESKFINHPDCVGRAVEKSDALKRMKLAGVPTPEFTFDKNTAREWLNGGATVFCRTLTQGMDGEGIVVAKKLSELVNAPLFTKFVTTVNEYRVHVMKGEVIYSNHREEYGPKGLKKLGLSEAHPAIRTGGNGWHFIHMDDHPSEAVQTACITAVESLGLDFAGVDVAETADGKAVVFEVNTAPELGPNTLKAYVKALKKHYGDYKNNENLPIRDA